jgi:hypothetical protein
MSDRDKLAEAIDSTIGHECHHTGPVDDSAPGGCGDCYALAKRVADDLIAAGFGDVREQQARLDAVEALIDAAPKTSPCAGFRGAPDDYPDYFDMVGEGRYELAQQLRAALTATEGAESLARIETEEFAHAEWCNYPHTSSPCRIVRRLSDSPQA